MLDRLLKRSRAHSTRAEQTKDAEPRSSRMPPERRGDLQRSSSGIPPLKEPKLPPGCAAVLIACTRSGRAYWIVFERIGSDWCWKLNLPATPADSKAETGLDPRASGDVVELIPMGGKDWGNWSCPGCGQKQISRGSRNYVHRTPCTCGTPCCLGPGVADDGLPTCPNCGREVTWNKQIGRDMYGPPTAGSLANKPMGGAHAKQIEG